MRKANEKGKQTVDCQQSLESVYIKDIMRSVQSASLLDELNELVPKFKKTLLENINPAEMNVKIDALISMFLTVLMHKMSSEAHKGHHNIAGLESRVGGDLLKIYDINNSLQGKSSYVNDLATCLESYIKKIFYIQGKELPTPLEETGPFVHLINSLNLDNQYYIYGLKNGKTPAQLVHDIRIERNNISHSAKKY